MTAPKPDEPAAGDPFARARTPLAPEAKRRGLTIPELLHRLARTSRRHAPAGTDPRDATLRWVLPHTVGDLPDGAVFFGLVGSGKTSEADRMRAWLTDEGTVLRGGREFIEFHLEPPEAGR
ncbi:hypothetical protein [Streptomyces sp. NPDC059631]|uniref:hypothetical protein n=1 Tax=unclassified Streptomyces TaxID=2593676 RepID=UPI00369D6EBF